MPAPEPRRSSRISAAVRVGDTVRRPRTPSSDAVQALLGHLHSAGFEGCPQPRGFDDDGREVVSYVEGDGGSVPVRAETTSDRALVAHATLMRAFHDASATFHHPTVTWNTLLRDPAEDIEVVCHNDLSIPNAVYRDGLPRALVDWEFAAPGRRLWDVAYAAWWLVPLHRPECMDALGWSEVDQPRRLGLFADAYGLQEERALLLDVLRDRQGRNRMQLRTWVGAGIIPAYDEDDPAVECGQPQYVQNIRPLLESALGLR
jgi:hypothetical protein